MSKTIARCLSMLTAIVPCNPVAPAGAQQKPEQAWFCGTGCLSEKLRVGLQLSTKTWRS